MDILNTENFYQSNLLVEQHFHGCYGVDFSVCDAEEILDLSKKLLFHGIGGFFPTLVTDSIENINRQIKNITKAYMVQKEQGCAGMAEILGIHLEGVFINPQKKGIHDENYFLEPNIENFKLIEKADELNLIKIVTLAPELDSEHLLIKYLTLKGKKVQAGHCVSGDLKGCHGVTHLFNAMSGISHRESSTALTALIDDNVYTEIIADGVHLSDDILALVFKSKPDDKIILTSDSLPISQSSLKEMDFAGSKIFYDGKKATSSDGTLAGSTAILDRIVAGLSLKSPDKFDDYVKMASDNLYKYHNVSLSGCIYWDSEFNIVAVEKGEVVLYKNE